MGGFSGQATDVDIQAREILNIREELNKILSKHTKQPIEKIKKDTYRDFYMGAEEAKEYGIIDTIVVKQKSAVQSMAKKL